MKRFYRYLNDILLMRNRHFLLMDAVAFFFTPMLALILRLESIDFLFQYPRQILVVILLFSGLKLVVFSAGGLYQRMWQHASIDELSRIILLGVILTIAQSLVFAEFYRQGFFNIRVIPRSVPILDGIVTIAVVGGLRFSIRITERLHQLSSHKEDGQPTLIVGAGDAGVMIAQELQANPQVGLMPVGFVDDDREKTGLKIRGVEVLGNRHDIPSLVLEYGVKQIIIAIPTASGKVIREINDICSRIEVKTSTIPGVFELLDGSVSIKKLRDIDIEDLLRREPVKSDPKEIRSMLEGKKVLVTGGGGSIGSEICRQVARCKPAQLIIVGHGENSIYTIASELSKRFPDLKFCSVIADIRDDRRMHKIFQRFRPQVVYHAAAHKHVPLMESNPSEAVANNIIGTYTVVKASLEVGVDRFVLISTDKAVNPTSVMGATKRVAEFIMQDAAKTSSKAYIAVRFGNVLGSRGSVVPMFRDQILRGGPVTITHPDVKRYFMTIPEAVHLVLYSSSIGQSGEVFVLDMGEPVRIEDLAKDLIRLSGLTIHKDIEIIYTGLRPGEKLFEELVLSEESFERTNHEKVFVCKNGHHPSYEQIEEKADDHLKSITPLVIKARTLVSRGNSTEIGAFLEEAVPGFMYVGGVEVV